MKPSRLKSVVVATDFSQGASLALDRALRLPLHAKAKLTIVNVIPADIPGRLQKQARDEAETRLERLLADNKAALIKAGLAPSQVVVDVLEGAPEKLITKRARTVEADVIVIGRHGRRPVADLFVGSTAQKVIREAEMPVLLVRSAAEWKDVLVAIDLTPASVEVLEEAASVAPQASLHAFNASLVPFEEYVTLTGDLALSFRDEFLADAESTLKNLLKKSGVKANGVVRTGDARALLVDEAKTLGAQLLVLGTHARKGLKRVLLGSVAEWVLMHAECDVLVMRAAKGAA